MWQASISTTAEAEEAVGDLLERAFSAPATTYCNEATGARTVTVYPSRLPEDAGALRIRLRGQLRAVRDCGLNFGSGKITIKPLPRENWAESWKRHFKPIDIARSLLIKPGWSNRRPLPGQKVVILDPGLSFGTGHHHTTLFCLRQIARCHQPGVTQSFLDIGSGSGILAIAAAKLGYAPIDAFDFDPEAVRVSRENVQKNQVRRQVWPQKKDLTKLPVKRSKGYDVICANLVCDLLVSEASKICAWLKPGGKLVVAGILRRQFGEVAEKLQKCGLTLEISVSDKTWRSGRFASP
jgi:ribosomal protein L11 methyltransferase